ncbi:MAG: isoleucine--tRNA ligase, partial [Treponema sp.]|nr:isoleucine--tRNA ligase [Treponema sp.]
ESLAIVTRNSEEKNVLAEMEDVIREELNVKRVIFHEREDELVEYRAKANFRVLGKEIGSLMKAAAAKIETLESDAIQKILDGSILTFDVEGVNIDLDSAKVNVERIEKENLKVINDGTLTVALDTKITDELKKEGYVRDLVRGIQNLRKERGFNVTDRIALALSGDEELKAAFTQFSDFIANETLATSFSWEDDGGGSAVETGDKIWRVSLENVR